MQGCQRGFLIGISSLFLNPGSASFHRSLVVGGVGTQSPILWLVWVQCAGMDFANLMGNSFSNVRAKKMRGVHCYVGRKRKDSLRRFGVLLSW